MKKGKKKRSWSISWNNLLPGATKKIVPTVVMAAIISFLLPNEISGQIYQSSPANWMYPAGNAAAVRKVEYPSASQAVDSMIIKWSTKAIAGDVTPLIGNIINNPRLFDDFPFAPNEMVAAVNNKIVIVDGGGRVRASQIDGDFVDRVSVLIDTLQPGLTDDTRNPLVMGLETIESISNDSLAYSYLVGYDHVDSIAKIVQRMAIDMRQYAPNVHASIKPVFGRQNGGNISIYATVNSNVPNVDAASSGGILPEAIYLRGFTQFDASRAFDNYPFSDIGDDFSNRGEFLPQVNKGYTSVATVNGDIVALLPSYPTPGFDFQLNNNLTNFTVGEIPSLMGFNLSGSGINTGGLGVDGIFVNGLYSSGNRPTMVNYWVRLYNPTTSQFDDLILMAEEYSGLNGSEGTARLQIFDSEGRDIATGNSSNSLGPPVIGGQNHGWSVASGNIDGISANDQLPFFPNNPGDEIIVTQSTKDAVFPGNKLMVLKYIALEDVPKPSPPNSSLFTFDTIFTQRISGWVAAVNDLDGAPDGKDEILLADNSRIMVIRARDYSNLDFRLGHRFDTLMVRDFGGETVSSASIADMDGDGKNDIVVTTFEKTYVIGAPLSSVLSFISPGVDGLSVCVGDTLDIEWRNILQTSETLDLAFIEIDSGSIPIDTISLRKGLDNPDENVSYKYLIDTVISGKDGYFILLSPEAPEKVNAISSLISIQASGSTFSLSPPTESGTEGPFYRVGDVVTITSDALCIDSLGAEYSVDGTNWLQIGLEPVPEGSDSHTYMVELPCIDVFDLSASTMQESIELRAVSTRGGYYFTSPSQNILIQPKRAPIMVDTALSACPSKEIYWEEDGFRNVLDSVYIAVSLDGGTSFQAVGQAQVLDKKFVWHVPLDVPNSLPLRLVSYDGCIATDTILGNSTPTYIDIVAPNPFNPYETQASIIYSVPEATFVDVEIYDQNDRLVARPAVGVSRTEGIAYCEKWDGLTFEGNLVKNGLYYIKLTMDIGITEIYPIFIHK